jgi:predicted nucleic acid-binding protein
LILLDASVLIEYLRGRDPTLVQSFRTLPLGICGITRAEILHGSRNDADRSNLTIVLNRFRPIPIPDSLWDAVGNTLNELRHRGLTVPFTDVALAALAVHLDIELWGIDAHFLVIAQVLPLRLYRLTPNP